MSDMMAQIMIALITATPPTIMASAAYRRAKRLEKPISEVNTAVNNRIPGQRKLIEVMDDVSETLETLNTSIHRIENDILQHRAWHQEETEYDKTDQD